jgi:ABC-type polysaccharide/polyol phosphate export permease
MAIEKIKKMFKLLPPLVARDIKERYAGSTIGIFWTVGEPVLLISLYWIVFSQVFKIRIKADTGDIPFVFFLLSGLLPWLAINEGILSGATSIMNKAHIIKKVFFHVWLFPLSTVVSAAIRHGISFIIFLIVFFIYQGAPSVYQISFLLLLYSLQLILTAGIAFTLSSLTVYVRDILQVLGVGLQVMFYLTTILYPLQSVPQTLKIFLYLNPITPIIESYHAVILYSKIPSFFSIFYFIMLSFCSLLLGRFVFRRLKYGFADVL